MARDRGGKLLIYTQHSKEVIWYIMKNHFYGAFGSHMQKQYGLNDFHSNHLIFPSYLYSIISGGSPRGPYWGKKMVNICMTKEFYHRVTINSVNLFLPRCQLDKISLKIFHMTLGILPSYLFGFLILYKRLSELFHSLKLSRRGIFR